MSHLDQSAELEWTAFCYVAGELPASEAAQFELRLESDQAACEAVVCAVQMAQAVSGLEPSTVAPRPVAHATGDGRKTSTRSAMGAVAVTAACLLLTVGALIWGRGPQSETSQAEAQGADRLVDLWAVASPELEAFEDDDVGVAEEESDDFLVPSWMLAAAQLDAAQWDPASSEVEPLQADELQHN